MEILYVKYTMTKPDMKKNPKNSYFNSQSNEMHEMSSITDASTDE